ncbi:LAGLIDADG family homing endonuclease [Patescibacteria group bacterium]|nr:LAGLIDADG family homing endonuclease [Patescibacteria group bacterium]
MSDKVSSVAALATKSYGELTDNQQGSSAKRNPSETIRRAPSSEKAIKAYLLGALHDATFSSNKRFRFSQKGTKWLKLLKLMLKKIGYNSWIYREGKNRSVYVLETLAPFLDFNFNPLKLASKIEKINYLKGFFDAEGGIPKNDKKFYIQLVQSDKEKLRKIKKILKDLKIETGNIRNPSKKVDPEYWRMYVLKTSHKKFVKLIGSLHHRKIKVFRKRMMI